MTDQELKKLRRSDLLELLIAQEKENERLRSQVEQLEKRLADRAIDLEQAGSIAEAALRLNGVFQAAQAAADQYLENIRRLSEEPEAPILKEGPAADVIGNPRNARMQSFLKRYSESGAEWKRSQRTGGSV